MLGQKEKGLKDLSKADDLGYCDNAYDAREKILQVNPLKITNFAPDISCFQ